MANNAGRLFKNKDYVVGSKRPLYKGQCEIDGIVRNMAAWVKKSQKGITYMYITFENADKNPAKVIAIPSNNKDGIRDLSTIAQGEPKKVITPAEMDVSDVPFYEG